MDKADILCNCGYIQIVKSNQYRSTARFRILRRLRAWKDMYGLGTLSRAPEHVRRHRQGL